MKRDMFLTSMERDAEMEPSLRTDIGDTLTAFVTGNATIEWDGPDRRGKSGDVGQLQLQYESRSRAFEYRSAATYSLNASWTHSLTRSLSFTATINHIGPNQYRYWVSTPLLQSHTFNHLPGPEYRFKLVKTFGGGKAPPPSSPPPVPVPR